MFLNFLLYKAESKIYQYNSNKEPYTVTLPFGRYFFKCVGASGSSNGGCGAEVTGVLDIFHKTTFYLYVGGMGSEMNNKGVRIPGGFNGGGSAGKGVEMGVQLNSGSGGGGASDIRYKKGSTELEEESLRTRIMVAGGGGGDSSKYQTGGHGGELTGGSTENKGAVGCGEIPIVSGGGQTSGGGFGKGADGSDGIWGDCAGEGNGGGGGGWYGGNALQKQGGSSNAGGGGGSSYISGYPGCDKNDKFVFMKTKMRGGEKTQHIGNGYIEIVKLNGETKKYKRRYANLIHFL